MWVGFSGAARLEGRGDSREPWRATLDVGSLTASTESMAAYRSVSASSSSVSPSVPLPQRPQCYVSHCVRISRPPLDRKPAGAESRTKAVARFQGLRRRFEEYRPRFVRNALSSDRTSHHHPCSSRTSVDHLTLHPAAGHPCSLMTYASRPTQHDQGSPMTYASHPTPQLDQGSWMTYASRPSPLRDDQDSSTTSACHPSLAVLLHLNCPEDPRWMIDVKSCCWDQGCWRMTCVGSLIRQQESQRFLLSLLILVAGRETGHYP
mmetsp:Transcript_23516/g.56067  ORF Transcript_23516/g.56067 Transcript_23516/m.56067 type:complete len:263 (+) Transcript_23516:387-1175(+)